MKREVTLGQVLSIAVTILIAVITGWVSLSNKVAERAEHDNAQDLRLNSYEINAKEVNAENRQLLREINGTVTDMRIQMQDKADRPK